jgi:mannose-6-phosphate isomerase-like protein (cupin superfamily)
MLYLERLLDNCEETILKSWGAEYILCNDKEHNYCAKILMLLPGKSTSLHSHGTKNETFIEIVGHLQIQEYPQNVTPDGICYCEKIIIEGETLKISSHTAHKLLNTGEEVIYVLEVSNYHSDLDTLRY